MRRWLLINNELIKRKVDYSERKRIYTEFNFSELNEDVVVILYNLVGFDVLQKYLKTFKAKRFTFNPNYVWVADRVFWETKTNQLKLLKLKL
jgi:hypothetical protein